jgi:hypothetical protein
MHAYACICKLNPIGLADYSTKTVIGSVDVAK